MAYENNDRKMESVYSKRIKAGKRRTYFFDVRETRGSDYYLTITESRKRGVKMGLEMFMTKPILVIDLNKI